MNNIIERLKIIPFEVPLITIDIIEFLEKSVGVSLPDLYKFLLLEYNGGKPEINTFWLNGNPWEINDFFFLENQKIKIENENMRFLGVLQNYQDLKNFLQNDNLLPFASDPGGHLYCFDISNKNYLPVVLWIHDDPSSELLILAQSFESFVKSLESTPNYESM